MKNFLVFPLRFLSKIFLSLFLILPLSCRENLEDGLNPDGDDTYLGVELWQELLPDIVHEKSLIVQQKGSIQAAIDEASPQTAIYIEPGTYKEVLTIDKPGIKLIGITGANGEQVVLDNPGRAERGFEVGKQLTGVEVRNIQPQNFADNTSYVSAESSPARRNHYFNMSREHVVGNIAHYQFEVRLGEGEFDVVRIHRVVKENRPYRPRRTKGEVFMVHGDRQNFDDIFYTAGAVNNISSQTSSSVYLASKGIDVWGIDLAWTLVPIETSDFAFMKNWGVEKDTEHIMASMSLVRLIRGLTGQGFGKLNLLGFCYGAAPVYDAAGKETQKPAFLRNIKGIVAADLAMKYAPDADEFRKVACSKAQAALDSINLGKYQNDTGVGSIAIGNLALSAPNDPTPIPNFQPLELTNYQVPIFLGANTYFLGGSDAPFFHFAAGNGEAPLEIATDLAYINTDRWANLFSSLAPYQPYRVSYDVFSCLCNEEEVSIDDYLEQIDVPIYYLGAGGAWGTYGEYTVSHKTASADITLNTITLLKNPCLEDRYKDYGHADLFMADNAPIKAWEPLRQWLLDHHADYLP